MLVVLTGNATLPLFDNCTLAIAFRRQSIAKEGLSIINLVSNKYTSSRPAQIFIQSGSLNEFYNLKQTVYNEPYKTD